MLRYFLLLFLSILLYNTSLAQLTLVSENLYCVEAAEFYKEYRYDEAYHRYLNCSRELSKADSFAYHLLLLNAGISAIESSDYLKAEKLLLTCKQYFLQDDSVYYYVRVLSNLAALEKRRTNYNQADVYLSEAIAIMEVQDSDCSMLAFLYNDRGVLCKRMGQYLRANDYFNQSLELKYNCSPKAYSSIGITLNNMAGTYLAMKDYDKADSLYEYVIQYKSEKLSPDNPSTLISWNNLAESYRRQGKNEKALEIFFTILQKKKESIGTHHPSYAVTLHHIGNAYLKIGNLKKAEEYTDKAIKLRTALYGKNHASTLNSLALRADILTARKEWKATWEVYHFIIQSRLKDLRTYFLNLSESEKMLYLKSSLGYWHSFEEFVLLLEEEGLTNQNVYKEAFQFWLETRWFLSGIAFRDTKSIALNRLEGDSTSARDLDELQDLRGKISRLYLMSDGDPSSNKEIIQLENRASILERKYNVTYSHTSSDTIKLLDVYHNIKSSDCLIELVRISKEKQDVYVALIYVQGQAVPHKINLSLDSTRLTRGYNYYFNAIRSGMEDRKSYEVFWKPVAEYLSTLTQLNHVFIVREGIYTLINLNSLKDEKGSFLFDRYQVHYLNSIDAFLNTNPLIAEHNDSSLFAVFRPAFCKAESTTCRFEDLPGTENEFVRIKEALDNPGWKISSLTGQQSQEELVRDTMSHFSILHFATHGYYQASQSSDDFIECMVKSGLLLAFSGEPELTEDGEDGLLTAYEISQLNLTEVNLVVLSACESGLGKVDEQEGVLGLQRAFFVSGTHNVLVSLWKIDDKVTAEWMANFYGFLANGYSVNECYQMTLQEMKKKYPRPYYWACFILIEG